MNIWLLIALYYAAMVGFHLVIFGLGTLNIPRVERKWTNWSFAVKLALVWPYSWVLIVLLLTKKVIDERFN